MERIAAGSRSGGLRMQQFRLVLAVLDELSATTRIQENRRFVQHGSTSVYRHCRNVALVSLLLCGRFRLHADVRALVRGALLHDYFLYDWHCGCHSWHGFRHPYIALRNASADCMLSSVESDIIVHHMFPLVPFPPRTLEGWIVTVSDKLCSLYETFRLNERHVRQRRRQLNSRRP